MHSSVFFKLQHVLILGKARAFNRRDSFDYPNGLFMNISNQSKAIYVAPTGALLSIPEASHYLGLLERALKHVIYTRRIPVVHIGRRVYLRQSDLDQLIENGTQA